MKLLEFFNFSPESNTNVNDNRYDAGKDTSILKKGDTRKMRLTLEQINTLRKQSEMHEAEEAKDLEFVKQMYGQPPAEPAAQ
jgi:hypothetical protein